jgi:hypothetical protein
MYTAPAMPWRRKHFRVLATDYDNFAIGKRQYKFLLFYNNNNFLFRVHVPSEHDE